MQFSCRGDAFEPQGFCPTLTCTWFYRAVQFFGQASSGDQVDQFVWVDVTRRAVSHHLPISENGHAIGNCVNFRNSV